MFERITWEEFLEWEALYDAEPWGETRADARQAVAIHYLLAPYLPKDDSRHQEWPEVFWPYWKPKEMPDPEAVQAAIDEHVAKWRELEAERLARVDRGKDFDRQSCD